MWRGGKGREEGHRELDGAAIGVDVGAAIPLVLVWIKVPHAHPLRDASTVIAGAVQKERVIY